MHFGTVSNLVPCENRSRVLKLFLCISSIRCGSAHSAQKDKSGPVDESPRDRNSALSASVQRLLGLLVEILTLLWFHPLSFVLFLFLGVILIGLGIAVYLLSLVFVVSVSAGQELGSSHFASKDFQKKELREERIEIPTNGNCTVPSYEKTLTES